MGIKVERLFRSFHTIYITLTLREAWYHSMTKHSCISSSSGCISSSIVVAASHVLVAAAFWYCILHSGILDLVGVRHLDGLLYLRFVMHCTVNVINKLS